MTPSFILQARYAAAFLSAGLWPMLMSSAFGSVTSTILLRRTNLMTLNQPRNFIYNYLLILSSFAAPIKSIYSYKMIFTDIGIVLIK